MSAPNGNLAKYGPQVKELALQGLTAPQVWEQMDSPLTRPQVIRVVQELRKKGEIPPKASNLTNNRVIYGDKIKELTRQGYKPTYISKALGGKLSRQQVSRITRSMREGGELPPFTPNHKRMPDGLTLGSISRGIMGKLTPQQRGWLYDECAKCDVETVAEYLLELVRDAHEESLC